MLNSWTPLTSSLLGLTCLASGCIPVHMATGSFDGVIPVDGALTLGVSTQSGDITITQGRSDEVSLRADITVEGSNQSQVETMVEDIETLPPVVATGDQVVIGDLSHYEWADELGTSLTKSIAISYVLEVPENTQVEAVSGTGIIQIQDLEGPIYVGADEGTVRISNINQKVTTALGNGTITVENAPSVEAALSQGDLVIREIDGSAILLASAANIAAEEIGGDLSIDMSSGTVRIESDLSPNAQWKVLGNIAQCDLYVPLTSSFYFLGQSGDGAVEIDLPHSVQDQNETGILATIGTDPSGSIDVTVTSGDIHLQSQ